MSKSKSKQRLGAQRARPPQRESGTPGDRATTGESSRWSLWTCAAIVFTVTWITFLPALDGAWLDWDDAPLLTDIQAWRGLTPRHLSWMFTTFHMGPYQPLSWLSYAVDHALWGMDPRAYHRTNLLLHAASAVCLFFVARQLLGIALRSSTNDRTATPLPAWQVGVAACFSALFWSIHPLRVESVAWITERRDCLSGLFFMLTLLAWLAHARSASLARGRWYWIALACFAASLLAKGLSMVLPLVMLVLDAWPLRRTEQILTGGAKRGVRSLVIEKWPFLALAVLAGIVAIVGQRAAGAMLEAEHHDTSARIAQAFYGLAFYVRKTLWPSDLMVLYPMSVPLDVGQARFVASAAGVVFAAVAIVMLRHRAPAAAAAFACYSMIVAPVLGLVQTGSQLVADRYSYQCTLPLSLLAGGALLYASRRSRGARSGALLGAGLLALAGATVASLALATRAQIRVWHDTLSLWEHDVAIDPSDSPGRRNLVAAWMDIGKMQTDPAQRAASFERALAECRVGMEQRPDAACMLNAAKIHDLMAGDSATDRQRHLETALDYGRRGIAIVERTLQRLPEIYESCGVILCELSRPAEAVHYFEQALALDSADANRHGMLAEALIQSGHAREAAAQLEEAVRLAPDAVTLWLDLADTRRHLGERDAALAAYRKVIALKQDTRGATVTTDADWAAAQRAVEELGHK